MPFVPVILNIPLHSFHAGNKFHYRCFTAERLKYYGTIFVKILTASYETNSWEGFKSVSLVKLYAHKVLYCYLIVDYETNKQIKQRTVKCQLKFPSHHDCKVITFTILQFVGCNRPE